MDKTISIEELIDIIDGEIYGDRVIYEDYEESSKFLYITNFLQKDYLEYLLDENTKNINSGFIITTSNSPDNKGVLQQEYSIYLTIGFKEIPLIIFTSAFSDNFENDYENWLYTSKWNYKIFNNVRYRKDYMIQELGEPELIDAPYDWVEKLYKMTLIN